MKHIALLLLSISMFACENSSQSNPQVSVEESQSLLSAEDFSLNLISGLIKSGVTDATAIQEKINDGDQNPYNNVDIDKDGQRDFIEVRETVHHQQFDFVTKPSSIGDDKHIATVKFTEENGEPMMEASYEPIVHHYHDYYYHDTFARDLLFFTWLHSSRPVYIGKRPTTHIHTNTVTHYQFINTQRSTNISPTPSRRPSSNYSFSSSSRSSSSRSASARANFSSKSGSNSLSSKPSFSSSKSSFSSKSSRR